MGNSKKQEVERGQESVNSSPKRLLHALLDRRQFLTQTARTASGVALLGIGIGTYSKGSQALATDAVRPPGALHETDFLSACTRCGQCVQDCPYDILKLADLGASPDTGTPYFNARTGPCEMCEDIPCVKACPTGALDHKLEDINQARMGLAVLIDQEACIAFQGLRCEVCFNVCPIRNKAIKLEYQHNRRSGKHALFIPVVYSEACTGCGICERGCILEKAAIKVLPIRLAKGELGPHYRLGWQQKNKEGKPLVSPDPEHKYNLPEGEQYDHAGRGWIKSNASEKSDNASSPFASNPIETLNRGLKGRN